jgi:hypothetical protein
MDFRFRRLDNRDLQVSLFGYVAFGFSLEIDQFRFTTGPM